MVEPAYFKTDFPLATATENALKDEKITLDHNGKSASLLLPQRTTTINMELLEQSRWTKMVIWQLEHQQEV